MATTYGVNLLFRAPGVEEQLRKLQGGTTKLDQAVKKTQKSSDDLTASINKQKATNGQLAGSLLRMRLEFNKNNAATQTARKRKIELAEAIQRTRTQLQQGKKDLEAYGRALDRASKPRRGFNLRGAGRGAAAGFGASGALSGIPGFAQIAGGAGAGGVAGGAAGAVAGGVAAGVVLAGTAAVRSASDIARWNAELQRSRVALEAVSNGSVEYQESLRELERISLRLNVPIGEATQQFTQLRAAMAATGFTGAESIRVFEALASANKALGGDSEKLQGILLASSQVFSKGKVAAEELRGQIGERLAGAFADFAKASGKSTAELDAALQEGEVSLEDFLAFAEYVGKKYGKTADKMAKDTSDAGARLTTAVEGWKQVIGPELTRLGGMFQDFATTAIKSVTSVITELGKVGTAIENKLAGGTALQNAEKNLKRLAELRKIPEKQRTAQQKRELTFLQNLEKINKATVAANAVKPPNPLAPRTDPNDPKDLTKLKGSALQELLRRIRSGEGDYTSVNRGRAGDTPGGLPGLTSMSIAEVMRRQQQDLFAVGAYQFIPETLRGAVQRSGIDPNERFSPANQDKLAIELILGGSKRPALTAYLTGRGGTLDSAQLDASREWAALLGPSGKGAYDGDSAGNMAGVNIRDLLPLVRKEVMGGGGAFDTLAADQFEADQRLAREAERRAEELKRQQEQLEQQLATSEQLKAAAEDQLYVTQSQGRIQELSRQLAADEMQIHEKFAQRLKEQLSDKEKENLLAAQHNELLQTRLQYEKDISSLAQEAGYNMGSALAGMMDQNKELTTSQELLKGSYDIISGSLTNSIKGLIDGTKEWNDVLSDVLGQLGSLFLNAAFKGLGSGIGIPGFADGGRPEIGQVSIVGERGPELFVPDTAGTVIPNDQMSAAMTRYSRSSGGVKGTSEGSAGDSVVYSPTIAATTMPDGQQWVTVEQMNQTVSAGMDAAAKRGAAGGHARSMSTLRNSRSQRTKLGL